MTLVTKSAVKVLSGPSASAPLLYGFPPGRPLRLIARDAGFAQIQDLKSGATGWVDENALAHSVPNESGSVPSEPMVAPSTTASIKQVAKSNPRPAARERPASGFLGGLFGPR
jgi:hypothetical protein